MNRTTASIAALIVLVACGSGSEAGTTTEATSSSSSSSTLSSSTTSVLESTTSQGTVTTDSGPPPTLAPAIAQTAFAFAGGVADLFVTVEVADSPDGPWLPAGFSVDFPPTLSGPSHWVRFTVENFDELGPVVDVEISGIDTSDLGEDVCDLDLPIEVGGSDSCIVGGDEGLPVLSGGKQNDYVVTALSQHQGFGPDRWFQPLVPTTVDFDGARHSFIFLFDIGSTDEGVRIDGIADAAEVEVDVSGLELSSPVRVDCTDGFPGGASATGGSPSPDEPPVVAYVIGNFSNGGNRQGECAGIPTETLEMSVDGDAFAYLYANP